jgi:hypothetical protein
LYFAITVWLLLTETKNKKTQKVLTTETISAKAFFKYIIVRWLKPTAMKKSSNTFALEDSKQIYQLQNYTAAFAC